METGGQPAAFPLINSISSGEKISEFSLRYNIFQKRYIGMAYSSSIYQSLMPEH
jgi:hypothetical protein